MRPCLECGTGVLVMKGGRARDNADIDVLGENVAIVLAREGNRPPLSDRLELRGADA